MQPYFNLTRICVTFEVNLEARRRAIARGTPEFPGQLIAFFLVAQWLEGWCASLAAQLLQGEPI